MAPQSTAFSLEQRFVSVKSQLNTQLPLFPDSMIHHNPLPPVIVGKSLLDIVEKGKRYGVSSALRILSPGLIAKRFDQVRDCFEYMLGLSAAEREVTHKLLRLYSYYGQVYPKAAQWCGEPGLSQATFWRTIRRLRAQGLVQVINRFLIRPHAQISNLYRLDKLVLLIARYLAEHGVQFGERWLKPYLALPGAQFWRFLSPFLSSHCDNMKSETT